MASEIIKKVKKIEITSKKLVNEFFGGEYHSVFKGQGIEFQEVREYVPGDEVKNIDWNVTARIGMPYIKKFHEERELTLMIALDLSGTQIFGSGSLLKREVAGEIAAAVAFSALKNNDKVGLLLFTDRIELFIPPRKGTKHILRILRDSVYFKPSEKKTSITLACNVLNSVLKRKGIVLFISDFLDNNFEKEIKTLSKRQDLIPVILRDKREAEPPDRGLFRLLNPETADIMTIDLADKKIKEFYLNKVNTHYKNLKTMFVQTGCIPVEIFTDTDWVKVLRVYFEKRIKRRR
ncbi:MAG: DUF58 domain-containing protein [Candidatus Hydrogenedentota bacterium]